MRRSPVLSYLQLLLSILLIALLLFPSSLQAVGLFGVPILFLGVLVLLLLRWLEFGRPLPPTRATLPILVFLLIVTLFWVLSPARANATLFLAELIAGVIAFAALLDHIRRSNDLWRAAALLVLFGLALALVTPFTVYWAPEKVLPLSQFRPVWPQLFKTTNSNIIAGALVPIVPIALALLWKSSTRYRLLGGLVLVLLAATLFLLESRGAIIALAVGLAVYVTLYRRWLLPLFLLGGLGVLLLNRTLGGPSPADLVWNEVGSTTPGSLVQRETMWRQAVDLIRQSPLLGIGMGAYPQVAPIAPPYSPAQPGWGYPHAHNLYLQLALDTGVVGVAAFLAIFGLAVASAWRTYRAGNERPLAIALLSSFAIIAVHSLGDTIMWGARSSLVLWFLFALAFGLDNLGLSSYNARPEAQSSGQRSVAGGQ